MLLGPPRSVGVLLVEGGRSAPVLRRATLCDALVRRHFSLVCCRVRLRSRTIGVSANVPHLAAVPGRTPRARAPSRALVDGVVGPRTRPSRSSCFSGIRGLKADGNSFIGGRARAFGSRGRSAARAARPSASGLSAGTSRYSSSGFVATGCGPRAVDGRSSGATAVALRRFQSRHTLEPDGIAGPFTYRAPREPRAHPPSAHGASGGELLLDRRLVTA